MILRELFTEAKNVWGKSGTKTVRKYRCTSGIRKGRTMSSPAACNAPLNIHKSKSLKQTKQKKSGSIKIKTKQTRRTNPASARLPKLNRPRVAKSRGRRIR